MIAICEKDIRLSKTKKEKWWFKKIRKEIDKWYYNVIIQNQINSINLKIEKLNKLILSNI